jgi:CDGSH-type Zn-finger protein
MATEKTSLTEEMVPCGCGRSSNGYCIGLHNMTEEQYQDYLMGQFDDLPGEDDES